MPTATFTPAERLAQAAALNAQAERLVEMLRNAYHAVVAADEFARPFIQANSSQFPEQQDDDVDRAMRILAGEFRSVDTYDLLGPLRAAEDLGTATTAAEEAVMREIESVRGDEAKA